MACRSPVGHRSKSKYDFLDALHLSVEWLIQSLYGDSNSNRNQLTEASDLWISFNLLDSVKFEGSGSREIVLVGRG